MKKTLLTVFRCFMLSIVLVVLGFGARASHIVGMDLHYTWISGSNYKITLVAYGDCGPSSASAFSTLPTAAPDICIYDGATYITTVTLHIDSPTAGKEITPVCAADTNNTQCHSTSSTIPGIKQFVYSGVYTVPHASIHWRFIYYGYMGSASGAGRAAAITNIRSGTIMQLTDTLNNSVHNNSNPVLTIVPVPFFCLNNADSYNPGGVDADGDSLNYVLAPGANGSGTGCSTAGYVSYLTGYTPSTPLSTYTGLFSFDPTTGEIAFTPNITQRSLVVYNIQEYRHDTLIGTSQREMTFLVLTCTNTPPSGGFVGSTGSSGGGTLDDSTHFHICANTDSVFSLLIAPTESDTSNVMYINTTGVPAGAHFTVLNDSTNHPTARITWTTRIDSGVTPGNYTFFIVLSDNNCPLAGTQTLAFHISILPIPTINYTIITPSTCASNAIVSVTPGGLGSPWAINFQDSATAAALQNFTGITGTFLDTLPVGSDSIYIFSNLSTFCNSSTKIDITQTPFPTPRYSFTSPTYCGANNGAIHITGMNPSELDTINYNVNGTPAPALSVLTSSTGTVDITSLCAGVYDNFVVSFGRCFSASPATLTLTNPSFTMSIAGSQNPSACGFNDGSVTLKGLTPGQLDLISYTFNGAPASFSAVVLPDSTLIVPNLYAGIYANFIATTVGACPGTPYSCVSNTVGPVTLTAPSISVGFDTSVHLGCQGDTVYFTNSSTPPAYLTYRWYFGDGATDTARNPMHIYHPSAATFYTAQLKITNGHCEDSAFITISLPGSAHSTFTPAPDTICQGNTITFNNTSTGVGDSYFWNYGDGNTGTSVTGSNTYNYTGAYTISLIATDRFSCADTSYQHVQVDSNTAIGLHLTDSVICRGGEVTFTGDFTSIGLQHTYWSFGDGTNFTDANPIQHAFDMTGNLTVNLTVTYRLCPTATISKNVRIYPNPNIYLGADTSICPGGVALHINDYLNASNPLASWMWNTGETTPGIVVIKPGTYSATVTIYGCVATDTVVVANDCYVDFPNVFSPNGDGVNDFFFPRQFLTKGLTEFKMDIYNRWGQMIYETTGTDGRGWDGNFNNTAQPEGVYIYIITAKFKDGEQLNKQGNITLMR